MKNKGFTLVELLAVVVILAIISLIAVPIVLNLIEKSRIESRKRSIDLYASAVNTAITSYQIDSNGDYPESFEDLKDNIDYKGEVSCKAAKLYKDGTFFLANCTVNGILVENYTYGIYKQGDGPCKLTDKDGDYEASLSDIVTCGTESFYVVSNNGSNVEMLSMYNLNVGDHRYPNSTTYGKQDEHVVGAKSAKIYGQIDFSDTYYWYDEENSKFTIDRDFVYGNYDDNYIYPHVLAYENYLKKIVPSATATIMSYSQALNLQKKKVEWLYLTTYWLGSVSEMYAHVYAVMPDYIGELLWMYGTNTTYCPGGCGIGVRPLITVLVKEIG